MCSRDHATDGQAPILVAEHNRDDALLLELAFLKAAPKVLVLFVYNGLEMVEYLQGKPPFGNREVHPLPGLLMIDLAMPCMSGLEFLAWLRVHPEVNHIPVIVLSGSCSAVEIRQAYELGAGLCLSKPNNFDQFVAIAETAEIYLHQHDQVSRISASHSTWANDPLAAYAVTG